MASCVTFFFYFLDGADLEISDTYRLHKEQGESRSRAGAPYFLFCFSQN